MTNEPKTAPHKIIATFEVELERISDPLHNGPMTDRTRLPRLLAESLVGATTEPQDGSTWQLKKTRLRASGGVTAPKVI